MTILPRHRSSAQPDVDDGRPVSAKLGPLLDALFEGSPPVRFEFWDGSTIGSPDDGTIIFRTPDAFRRMLWAPRELGLGRAFVCGELDVIGTPADVLRRIQHATDVRMGDLLPATVAVVRSLGALGLPPPPPPEEAKAQGIRHSLRRDKQAISHHYDVGNDFYSLILGESMTYSCARFVTDDMSLAEAQAAKHELICRKLGLTDDVFRSACTAPRPRLLDVGCGWGSMAMHAAAHHDVDVVGVTISEAQAALARERVAAAGLTDRVEIRVQDYREIDDGPFDVISSIGMAEHVGKKRMLAYFAGLHAQLRSGGRMLNHAIGSIGGSRLSSRSFVGRYVFPDGELLDLADTVRDMERAGFEVRDVENLREHYATTLRRWVANLQERWDDAVDLVGERRARVWLLYMSGSINGFHDGGLQIYQTLGIKSHRSPSDLPPTRLAWG